MTPYQKCLTEIEALKARGIHKSLVRIEAALRALGNPQERFPTIHIAGTNGKGSTAAITSEILAQSGFKTGLTISPHIINFRERIQINGNFIPEEGVVDIHDRIKKAARQIPLTYFEWSILMAFYYFAASRVDIAVIETGMGGRWDATNVIFPLVAGLTNVSLEHEEYLGKRVEDILVEKMQIFKPGLIAWSGVHEASLWTILQNHCHSQGIPLYKIDDYFRENEDESFCIFNYHLKCSLLGAHQKRNAALSVALCHSLTQKGYRIPEGAVESGVANVQWPGRLEIVLKKPLVLLDGAHNKAGIDALVLYLKEEGIKYHLVFGTLKDRPFDEMLKPLLPYCITTRLALFSAGDRSLSINELMSHLKNKEGSDFLEINPASWKKYLSGISANEAVLVTGSLYLVSSVRAFFKEGS